MNQEAVSPRPVIDVRLLPSSREPLLIDNTPYHPAAEREFLALACGSRLSVRLFLVGLVVEVQRQGVGQAGEAAGVGL